MVSFSMTFGERRCCPQSGHQMPGGSVTKCPHSRLGHAVVMVLPGLAEFRVRWMPVPHLGQWNENGPGGRGICCEQQAQAPAGGSKSPPFMANRSSRYSLTG